MIINCDNCRIGRLFPIPALYLDRVNGQIMVVRDAPAYRCDVCGQVEYDGEFIEQLERLVEQLTDTADTRPNVQWPSRPGDDHFTWLSTRRSI